MNLRDELQAALGTTYTLERELGGGGMSRVFLAVENALGRKVVIKVLAPELAVGVSGERFAREIRLAANLQHPNIVPLHAAGEAGGLPYYMAERSGSVRYLKIEPRLDPLRSAPRFDALLQRVGLKSA